jgi:ankyrin repeat protein
MNCIAFAAILGMQGERAARVMLQQGDIDAHTALEWACYSGHLNIVRYLMREGQVSLVFFATQQRIYKLTDQLLVEFCCCVYIYIYIYIYGSSKQCLLTAASAQCDKY